MKSMGHFLVKRIKIYVQNLFGVFNVTNTIFLKFDIKDNFAPFSKRYKDRLHGVFSARLNKLKLFHDYIATFSPG